MIYLDNRTDIPLELAPLEKLAAHLSDRDVELILCTDDAIAELNRRYRNKEGATDVLSFPLAGEMAHQPLGSVVISVERAASKSSELGHTIPEEILLLFLHGLLHLLGYDHEHDEGEMRAMEERIIRQMELPESLIVRSERNDQEE